MLCIKSWVMFAALLISVSAASMMAFADNRCTIKLSETAYVAGNELKSGAYTVKWEANSPTANVEFMKDGKTVAETKCKIEEREKAAEYNGVMTDQDSSGHKVIKEIRFAGKKKSLIFQ
jgi:hypothetical protein